MKAKRAVLKRHSNRCAASAVSANIRHFMHYGRHGRPVAQKQAIAISFALLKRACGCSVARFGQRMTPKEIVSRCSR